jgi:hypothetical protein
MVEDEEGMSAPLKNNVPLAVTLSRGKYGIPSERSYSLVNETSSGSILRIFWSTMNVAKGNKDALKQMNVFMRLHFTFMA